MPESDDSRVDAAYQHGLALARDGSYFDAHEAFETAWRACEESERDFFQGLVHVVVSAYQGGRGKPVAAERQRQKALRRLAAYAPRHRGIDVEALRTGLERSEPDLRHHLVQAVAQPEILVEEEQDTEHNQHRA